MAEIIGQTGILSAKEDEAKIVDDSSDESVAFDEYFISSYGLDFDVEGIVRRYNRGDIEIPEFQRDYIWTKPQASRFIESLLLGLPVPGIFLYREDQTRKLTVIDGQQRIRTLQCFYDGAFVDGKPFKLRGLSPESRFLEAEYKSLGNEDRRKLDDSIIHATIIRQERPEDDGSSKYFVFERLNTGGTWLNPQEIRSAIYAGRFCELLVKLNKNESWRQLFGNPHKRKRDEELILRFLALFHDFENYRPSMTRFLNGYMQNNRNLDCKIQREMEHIFSRTVNTILNKIDIRAFKPQNAINAAVLDAIMVGVAKRLQKSDIRSSIRDPYDQLLANSEFEASISGGTSQGDKVRQRIKLAIEAFADAE
ncbi:MAG: DUF262 domain-containing protein [Anaerolineaceae bacterium]|nr:DUF262 domain-containing protein [Anaerolineaceae bacterium]